MDLKKKTQEILVRPYLHALFYNFPGGLRFELSEGGSPLDEVLTALRKATVICTDVFSGQERIVVHLKMPVPTSQFHLRKVLRELKLAGVPIPEVREIWLEENQVDDGDDENWYWVNCAFEAPIAKLQNLLWCAINSDYGSLRPNPHCRIYLLNPENGIVAHVYGDRGMDVISRVKPALTGLYERYKDMLLDYDMDAMRQTFAES